MSSISPILPMRLYIELPGPVSFLNCILTRIQFSNFSKVWGEKYVTSNVQIINPTTGAFEYIGNQYRYFTTAHGRKKQPFSIGRS